MSYDLDTINGGPTYEGGRTASEVLQDAIASNPDNNPEAAGEAIVAEAIQDLAGRSAVEHVELSATQPLPPTEAK